MVMELMLPDDTLKDYSYFLKGMFTVAYWKEGEPEAR